ncbi:MAG: hypothetical protein ACRD3W_18540, partial [Terriglobales bacterium]
HLRRARVALFAVLTSSGRVRMRLRKEASLLIIAASVCSMHSVLAQTIVPVTPDAAQSAADQKAETEKALAAPQVPKQHKADLPADYSLWYRYYQAGEDAMLTHNDLDLAKKYYLASLGELEKHPPVPGQDMWLKVKLSGLEYGLMHSYPKTWPAIDTGNSQDVVKLRKDQMDVYYRIARLNDRYAEADDLLRVRAIERYNKAKKEYSKALADASAAKAAAQKAASTQKEAAASQN